MTNHSVRSLDLCTNYGVWKIGDDDFSLVLSRHLVWHYTYHMPQDWVYQMIIMDTVIRE